MALGWDMAAYLGELTKRDLTLQTLEWTGLACPYATSLHSAHEEELVAGKALARSAPPACNCLRAEVSHMSQSAAQSYARRREEGSWPGGLVNGDLPEKIGAGLPSTWVEEKSTEYECLA
mmetsp:Transcript_20963/g.38035  ORF Transcript_20963/g.38035 Transcript_20963/m.38035 type:complete len:120 (-) Transcript_20963:262-621(-)